MNALKILAGLLELPKAERDMIIQLAGKASAIQAVVIKEARSQKIGRKGVRKYRPQEKKYLDRLFKDKVGRGVSIDEFVGEAASNLGRSEGAIRRKWDDFIEGRSDNGTWDQWVGGDQ